MKSRPGPGHPARTNKVSGTEYDTVPPIDSLPTEAAKPKTEKGKGKQPDRGIRRPREDDEVGDESRKKRKLVKSKPVITVSDDEDDQPTGTIVVKVSLCFILVFLSLTSL
jgi:hypothetical protein